MTAVDAAPRPYRHPPLGKGAAEARVEWWR